MSAKTKSLRTPLAIVRGLGSAKSGTDHWWKQRMTAVVLIPLLGYLANGFYRNVIFGDHDQALAWLSTPLVAVFIVVALWATVHHAILGLQVVIEDYVHHEPIKIASLIGIRLFFTLIAVLGTAMVGKIFFFTIVSYMIQNAQPQQH